MTETSELNDFNAAIVDEFRANGGKVGGPSKAARCCCCTPPGPSPASRGSRRWRISTIDGRTIIIGSYAGGPKDPAWVHNLRANPRAHIEVGTDAYDVTARELPLDERNETWPKVTALAPTFGEYQSKTSRVIPLFELTRV